MLLDIEVMQNCKECTIALSQCSYLESITHHFGFNELKPVLSPMEPHTKLTNAQSPSTSAKYAAMQHIPWCEAVGSLMYAALSTHPDIFYAISTVSRQLHGYGIPAMGHRSGYHAVWVWVQHVSTHTLTHTLSQVLPHMVSHGSHLLLLVLTWTPTKFNAWALTLSSLCAW